MNAPSLTTARLLLIVAAVLWSTSSVFIRSLQHPTELGVESPNLSPLQIAFYRSFFAGLALSIFLRHRDLTWRPSMAVMVMAFGIMTALYISALGRGSAANAILLQNTSPVWVYLIGVVLLGQPHDRRTMIAVIVGLVGALVIVGGNWPRGLSNDDGVVQQEILLMAAGSGFFYALVMLFLRHLRAESAAWLSVLNLFGGSFVILAFAVRNVGLENLAPWLMAPSIPQLGFIAVYGLLQLAIPYVMFARGLKTTSPQEAGIITLIEPVLNPVWAYFIAPDRETPTVWTAVGGCLLLAALAWRYWPQRITTPMASS